MEMEGNLPGSWGVQSLLLHSLLLSVQPVGELSRKFLPEPADESKL